MIATDKWLLQRYVGLVAGFPEVEVSLREGGGCCLAIKDNSADVVYEFLDAEDMKEMADLLEAAAWELRKIAFEQAGLPQPTDEEGA